jgi:polyhydroxyalkanoate synthesis regulator phasin
MPDELEAILRLVADGRLTPEEAAPIIDALTRAERAERDPFPPDVSQRLDREASRLDRHLRRAERRMHRAVARAGERIDEAGGRQLRIQVKERGRQRVNLRIPIGFVDTAIGFVPGLGGEQADRIRDAVRTGEIGPIIDVEDPDGDGVLISVE